MDWEADVLIGLLTLALVLTLAAVVVLAVIAVRARRAQHRAQAPHPPPPVEDELLPAPAAPPAFGAPSLRSYHRDDYADELHCIACETLLIEGTMIYVVPLPDAGDHAVLAVCQGCAHAPLGSAG